VLPRETPMKSVLAPGYYCSDGIHEKERERIFGRLWIFAGLKSFVSRPDGYISRRIAGIPVVVQNFDGQLRAFQNLCAHRQNPVQPEGYGTRPLVCGYHGWRYGCDGLAAVIPLHDEFYRFGEGERRQLGLRPVHLREVGELLFVNFAAEPLPITDQFSPALMEALVSVSAAFDDEVLVARWRVKHNWKLAYENLRDGLHPRFVHTRSLALDVKFEPLPQPAEPPAGAAPTLADLSFGGPEGTFLQERHHGFHDHVERWGSTNAYFNWLLFPNTHVLTSDGGYSFSVEHHDPVGPGVTELTSYYMTARKKHPWRGSAAALVAYAKGAKVILDEDIAVMEAIQGGFHPAAADSVRGAYERDNRRVDAWYGTAMGAVEKEGA
jgi:phenylpropionate dioxygenase-like ring-hydroxylating dioxygenase large terminal subunit